MSRGSRSIFGFLLIGFQIAACAKAPAPDFAGALHDGAGLVAALAEYRCTYGLWPDSAVQLRQFIETERNELHFALSERAWEILNHSEFRSTPEGALRIQGRFEAGEPPFPDSERPIELDISLESESCSPLRGEPPSSDLS